MNLVSNPDLRKNIIQLFDVEMDILDTSEVQRMTSLFENMTLPIQRKHFYRDRTANRMPHPTRPLDYGRMMNDPEFYAVCTEIAYRQSRAIGRYIVFNDNSRRLIEKIDAELEVLE